MSFLSPSKLSATAKIALFETSPRSRRRKLSSGGGGGGGREGNLLLKNSALPSDSPDTQNQHQNPNNNSNRFHRGKFISPSKKRHSDNRKGTNNNKHNNRGSGGGGTGSNGGILKKRNNYQRLNKNDEEEELNTTSTKPTTEVAAAAQSSSPACVVTKLQQQVKDLEERIHDLDKNGGRVTTKNQHNNSVDGDVVEGELSEIEERDDHDEGEAITSKKKKKSGGKSGEVRKLQRKLRGIQEGLIMIELERLSLKEKSTRLQEEKETLEKELSNRDHEIASLTRRCASQADRLQEISKLRSTNQELAVKVQQLKVDSSEEIDVIRNELQRCRQERDQLARRLESVQADYDDVAKNLESCATTIGKLIQEKQEWEAEKKRLVTARDSEMDQLDRRLRRIQNHHNDTTELKEQVRVREERIQILEEQSVRQQKESASELDEARKTRDELQDQIQLRDKRIHLLEGQSLQQQKDAASELEEAINTRDELKEQLRLRDERIQLLEEQSLRQQRDAASELEDAIKTRDEKMQQLEISLQDKSTDQNSNNVKLNGQLKMRDERIQLLEKESLRQQKGIASKLEKMITSRDEKIVLLEKSLKEKSNDHKELQQKALEMDRKYRLDRVNENRQYLVELSSLQDEYAEHLAVLRMELHDKDAMITVLENEVADTFGKLIVSTQALEKAEEQSSSYQTLMEDVSTLEQERATLLEADHEKDTEIAELSAEILKLEIEKEFIVQESNTNVEALEQTNKKLKAATKEVERLKAQSIKKSKLNAFRYNQLIESLNEHLRKSEERVRHLEDKLLQQQEQLHLHDSNTEDGQGVVHNLRKFELEEKATSAMTEASQLKLTLKAKELELSNTIKTYESKIQKLESNLEGEWSNLGQDMVNKEEAATLEHSHQLQEELNAAVSQVASQKHQIESLEVSLQERTDHLNEVVSQNKTLDSKLEENSIQIARLMNRNQSLQEQLADQEDELERAQEDKKFGSEQKSGIGIVHSISPQDACANLAGKENVNSKPNVVTPFKLPWQSPGS